jgi:Spy/CpxP family protein refolding chaperone
MALRQTIIGVAAALTVATITAHAQTPRQPGDGPGYGMGPGHGMGPGARGGYGPGAGMGAGMMGGMGPGMMGGGMGPGMTGGMGSGMMGGGMGFMALRYLDLNDQQRAQANRIHDDLRRKNWDLLGRTQDETAKLRDLYSAEKFDRAAVTAAYKRLGELRQARIENSLEAHEKLDAILTPEQRKALRRWAIDADLN